MSTVKAIVRLVVPAGAAKPGPAIGQALGPHGLNMVEFCKAFNAATEKMIPETPIPVKLTAFTNRTFTFITKSPPTTYLLKRCAGIEKGATTPGRERVGSVTLKQVYAIAELKARDDHLRSQPLEGLCRSIISTAGSMGVEVVDDRDLAGADATADEVAS